MIEEWKQWPWPTRILLPVWMAALVGCLVAIPLGASRTWGTALVLGAGITFTLNMALVLLTDEQ